MGWAKSGSEKHREKIIARIDISIISSDNSLIKILALEAKDQDSCCLIIS